MLGEIPSMSATSSATNTSTAATGGTGRSGPGSSSEDTGRYSFFSTHSLRPASRAQRSLRRTESMVAS